MVINLIIQSSYGALIMIQRLKGIKLGLKDALDAFPLWTNVAEIIKMTTACSPPKINSNQTKNTLNTQNQVELPPKLDQKSNFLGVNL